MRIRLHASDRLPFWIIGDPALNERTEASQSLEDRVQITRNQQPVTGAEWEVKTFYDRQNGSVVYEVTGRREFASDWARHEYLMSLAPTDLAEEAHRWEGDVYVRFPNADSTFNESKLPDAVISLAGQVLDGAVGLRLTYRIQAGGFDVAANVSGVEKVALEADGISGDACQMVLFATTSGGAFDNAGAVISGTAPSSLTAGQTLSISIGYEGVSETIKLFKAVAPGGSTPGFIAIETPVVSNLAVIATAFAGVADLSVQTGTFSGRSGLYLGCSSSELALPYINITTSGGYSAESTGANFNAITSPGVSLYDGRGVRLIADRMT